MSAGDTVCFPLSQSLIDELSSAEFEQSCDEFFAQLDKAWQHARQLPDPVVFRWLTGVRGSWLQSTQKTQKTSQNWKSQFWEDGNGTLEPAELLPVVQELTQVPLFGLSVLECLSSSTGVHAST